jgi:hypothetical protein
MYFCSGTTLKSIFRGQRDSSRSPSQNDEVFDAKEYEAKRAVTRYRFQFTVKEG